MTPTLDGAAATIPPEAEARLRAFAALAARWTARINLVAPSTVPRLWERHVLDSAQLLPLAPEGARTWADLGAGGGFPGMVVAVLGGDALQVTLVESDARKCAFLRTAVRELGLAVAIVDRRAEEAEPLGADVVSARALAPLSRLLPLAARHLAPGGTAILPKGRDWAAEVEVAEAAGWRFALDPRPSATDSDTRLLVVTNLAHG